MSLASVQEKNENLQSPLNMAAVPGHFTGSGSNSSKLHQKSPTSGSKFTQPGLWSALMKHTCGKLVHSRFLWNFPLYSGTISFLSYLQYRASTAKLNRKWPRFCWMELAHHSAASLAGIFWRWPVFDFSDLQKTKLAKNATLKFIKLFLLPQRGQERGIWPLFLITKPGQCENKAAYRVLVPLRTGWLFNILIFWYFLEVESLPSTEYNFINTNMVSLLHNGPLWTWSQRVFFHDFLHVQMESAGTPMGQIWGYLRQYAAHFHLFNQSQDAIDTSWGTWADWIFSQLSVARQQHSENNC